MLRHGERHGDCRADAGGTSAAATRTSCSGSSYRGAGNTAALRISPSLDSRTGEERTDPHARDDTPRPRQ